MHELLVAGLPDIPADRDGWLARWRWQHWENPYRQECPAGWVLTDGERIVGHLGAVHVPVRAGDDRLTGVIGSDYVVAEDAAATSGVFAGLQLAEAFFGAASDCVAMATTANEKTGAVFGRFGCRPVAWTREFWRVGTGLTQQIRACHGATSRIRRRILSGRWTSFVSHGAGWLYERMNHRPAVPIPPGCRLETTVPQLAGDLGWIWEGFACDDDALDDERTSLLPRVGSAGRGVQGVLGIDRTRAYLDWRYKRHPQRDRIRVLTVRNDDGHPLGAAIVFLDERAGSPVTFLEELITLPRHTDVTRTLLCAALKLAGDYETDYLISMAGRPSIRHLFWELGFEQRDRGAPAVVIQPPTFAGQGSDEDISRSLEAHFDFWHGEMF